MEANQIELYAVSLEALCAPLMVTSCCIFDLSLTALKISFQAPKSSFMVAVHPVGIVCLGLPVSFVFPVDHPPSINIMREYQ